MKSIDSRASIAWRRAQEFRPSFVRAELNAS